VIAADLAPPITTVFLFGVFWRRGTKEASFATLVFGFLMSAVWFVLDLPVFGDEKIVSHRWGISFMMQAWWGFCICSVFYIVVSLLTPPPPPEKIEGLTWSHPLRVIFHGRPASPWDPRILASSLLCTIAILYYMFR
jgi:SSS family solute:Na+ symporter